jgi:plasmid stabilization system protein ParE
LGLGFDFLRALEACDQLIHRHPQMHQMVHEHYRRALLRRFPFAIFYEHGDGKITVYAVFHVAQSPDKWLERM